MNQTDWSGLWKSRQLIARQPNRVLLVVLCNGLTGAVRTGRSRAAGLRGSRPGRRFRTGPEMCCTASQRIYVYATYARLLWLTCARCVSRSLLGAGQTAKVNRASMSCRARLAPARPLRMAGLTSPRSHISHQSCCTKAPGLQMTCTSPGPKEGVRCFFRRAQSGLLDSVSEQIQIRPDSALRNPVRIVPLEVCTRGILLRQRPCSSRRWRQRFRSPDSFQHVPSNKPHT